MGEGLHYPSRSLIYMLGQSFCPQSNHKLSGTDLALNSKKDQSRRLTALVTLMLLGGKKARSRGLPRKFLILDHFLFATFHSCKSCG